MQVETDAGSCGDLALSGGEDDVEQAREVPAHDYNEARDATAEVGKVGANHSCAIAHDWKPSYCECRTLLDNASRLDNSSPMCNLFAI